MKAALSQKDQKNKKQQNQKQDEDQVYARKIVLKSSVELFKEEEINALFYLGLEYQNNGLYTDSRKSFEEMFKQIHSHPNQHNFQNVMFMAYGYMAEIGYFSNDFQLLDLYIHKSYDKISYILRNEGKYIDLLLQWLDRFINYLSLYLTKRELAQNLEVLEVANSQAKDIAHEEVYREKVLGKAYYYSGNYKQACKHFINGLIHFDQSTNPVRENIKNYQTSNYRMTKNLLENRKEIAKQKLKRHQEEIGQEEEEVIMPYVRPVDQNIIAEIYDWLTYIYIMIKDHKHAKECFDAYQKTTSILLNMQPEKTIFYQFRNAKFDFLYGDYASSLQNLETCIHIIDKMSKFNVTMFLQLEYSNMLRWLGLILLILRKDQEAQRAFEDSLNVFSIFKLPGHPKADEPIYFILESHIGIAFSYLNVNMHQHGKEYALRCINELKKNKQEFQSPMMLNSRLDIHFILGYFASLSNEIDLAISEFQNYKQLTQEIYELNSIDKQNKRKYFLIHDYLSRLHIKQGNYIQASQLLEKQRNLNKESEFDSAIQVSYKMVMMAHLDHIFGLEQLQ